MTGTYLVYICLAFITALLLALFHYLFNSKVKTNLKYLYTALRALVIFGFLTLIINPKIEKINTFNEKPNLLVALDNSSSIDYLEKIDVLNEALDQFRNSEALNSRFNIHYFSFGNDLKSLDSLSFTDENSNISNALSQLSQIYTNDNNPIILITDGNQTKGLDYDFKGTATKNPVYPIILGDSIKYLDVSIGQLNTNRYAFLNNKFPVEVFVNYNGPEAFRTALNLYEDDRLLKRVPIAFEANQGSINLNITLEASKVGLHKYKAVVPFLENEKNTINNTKPFAVEVIDEKSKIALVHDFPHPDIGSLKKAIESNEQRAVVLLDPQTYVASFNQYQLAIIYQPSATFRSVFDLLEAENLNSLIITGDKTQWTFLNEVQSKFRQEITGQKEEVQAIQNSSYNNFILSELKFSVFPPLNTAFGNFKSLVPIDPILFQSIKGFEQDTPLLFTLENRQRREAVLLGSGIWRWRAQHYILESNFNEFDDFINKLVQYLSSTKRNSRLNVNYDSFYNANDDIVISAQYFNKNYEFDNKAVLKITLVAKDSDQRIIRPLVIKQNNYQVDLSDLESGEYSFTLNANSEIKSSGSFSILAFDLEKQFLNANYKKLQRLAKNTNGTAYFDDNANELFAELISDNRFKPVLKSTKNVVPLIDLKWLLFLLVILLAIEWFSRKYNGLT